MKQVLIIVAFIFSINLIQAQVLEVETIKGNVNDNDKRINLSSLLRNQFYLKEITKSVVKLSNYFLLLLLLTIACKKNSEEHAHDEDGKFQYHAHIMAPDTGDKKLEETLKWGEPSYLTKHGSTLRMDWKAKTPNQYAMYFKCTSRLVEAFKVIFSDTFQFEGKRAIAFQLNQKIPVDKLKQCIAMTLTYHKVKHLPLLGA